MLRAGKGTAKVDLACLARRIVVRLDDQGVIDSSARQISQGDQREPKTRRLVDRIAGPLAAPQAMKFEEWKNKMSDSMVSKRRQAMQRWPYTLVVLLALTTSLWAAPRHSSSGATTGSSHVMKAPNIVIVLADDLGYGDPGCYNASSKIRTPNMDRLASEGIRFTDAHSPAAWCTPSRYGLLTGRYPWRSPRKQEGGVIESERLTLPALLGQHDYRTACIGKWHLGFDLSAVERDFTLPFDGGPRSARLWLFFRHACLVGYPSLLLDRE